LTHFSTGTSVGLAVLVTTVPFPLRDGATSLPVRRHQGLSSAVLFNSDTASNGKKERSRHDRPLVHQAANAVKEWPERDRFDRKISPRRERTLR
jgi:hypothetical protein